MHVFHPDGLGSFDMGTWQEDDGTAFLVRSVNNEYLGISQLSPDYTVTTGLVSTAPRVCPWQRPRLIPASSTGVGSYPLVRMLTGKWQEASSC